MRIRRDTIDQGKTPMGYTLWLSARDTEKWARRPGRSWPCSELAGCAVKVDVDANGICDLGIDCRSADPPADELAALVADHLPRDLRHLWPVWCFDDPGHEGEAMAQVQQTT